MDVLNDEKASEDIPPKTNSPSTSEHDPSETIESNIHIHTFNQIPFSTDDDIPSSNLDPLDWDQ